MEVVDPRDRQAQIFVAVLWASLLTFAMESFGQRLPDWIEGQTRRGSESDRLRQSEGRGRQGVVVRADAQSSLCSHSLADHYDTTILPPRSRKPRDRGTVVGALLIVERWILARLRHRRFLNLTDLNTAWRFARGAEQLADAPYPQIPAADV